MRATGQVQSLTGPLRNGTPAGRRPRDSGRMAGRFRRRLAGLRRRLARHQDDRRAPPGRRSGVGHQPRTAVAATRSSAPGSLAANARAAARQLRAGARRHGAERRPDSGDGDRKVPAPRAARMARSAGGHADHASIEASSAAATFGRGRDTLANFFGPIQTIIPWACNHYTETLIDRARAHSPTTFGDSRCSAACRAAAWGSSSIRTQMRGPGVDRHDDANAKRELQSALPFAMEPVVYDFAINDPGTGPRC